MAVLSQNALTLLDHAKRFDEEGKVAKVAEILSQSNEILDDAMFMEGNLPTGHRVVQRTGLPPVFYRSINQGIPTSKSETAQIDEGTGMLEAVSSIDKDLAELNGTSGDFRLSEDVAFIEAMNQTMAGAMFYGNPAVDTRQFMGFSTRYSSKSAGNGQNILDAGGTGTDNTSIWLVVWGDQTVFGIFPKGSQAGLLHNDLGEQTIFNGDGTRYQALSTRYQWKNGLVVKDWRYVVRIANIDVSDLMNQTGTQGPNASTNIIKLMSRATDRIPNINMGKAAFYMNRTVHSGLKLAAMDRTQYVLEIEKGLDQFGQSSNWTSFLGIPLRRVDQILNTESRVV